MIGLSRAILRQRSAVILLALILLVAGGVTATRMQEELLPNISFDTVSIVTPDPGADPTSVLADVTKPIEAAVSAVPGLHTLSSTSAQNDSVVIAQFNYGTDVNQAESRISTAVSALSFPAGVQTPKVSTVDFSAFPILYLAVRSRDPRMSLQQIYALVKGQIAPRLAQIDGVAAADVGGGATPRVSVTLHPAALARYGVSVAQVDALLQANNVGIPAGSVTANGVTEPVVTTGRLTTLAQFRALPLAVQAPPGAPATSGATRPDGSEFAKSLTPAAPTKRRSAPRRIAPRVVTLGDVATISQGQGDINTLGTTPGEIAGIVRYNGRPAISITIRKNSDANIVKVSDAVEAKIATLAAQYPALRIATLYDSSTSIKDSVNALVRDGALGAVFAVVVIFIFLLTVRTTLVTAVSIPLSIFIAILILGAQGITLNVMTISAIAVAVGRVVDDAIVVLENIYRHVQLGEERREAVVRGVSEVGRAILGSTITTVAVFLPIGFVGGIIGQFFQPFALTVTFALVASLVVALTVVPALGSVLVRRRRATREGDTIFQRVYTPVLTWSLGHRAITLGVALALFVGSLGLAVGIPKGFLPSSNENIAEISVNLPPGASLGRTTATVARVESDVIAHQPGISKWETIIGYDNNAASNFGNSSASNAATTLAVYAPDTDMARAMSRLKADLAPYNAGGVSIKGAAVADGPPSNVDVQVTGADQSLVATATRQVISALRGVGGLTDLQSNLQTRQPQVTIAVDPARAFLHGLTPETAALAIRQLLTGQTVTTVQLDGQSQESDVFVQVDPAAGNTVARIRALTIGTPLAPIGAIARVSAGYGPVNIARQGQQNIGDVTAGIDSSAGAVTGKVASAIAPLAKRWAARDIAVGQAGVGQQLTNGFANMGIAMLVAIGLVYVVLVMLFRSLLVPFVILFAVPLALIGALIALAVTGRALDLSALIGMLMLIGVVVTNAIVLLDLVQHKIEAGDDLRTALVQGGRTRVRPILMTATATILALMPLAFSTGGGLIAASLATVVIGGLLSSTLLTLVVVPVIYSLLIGLRGRLGGDARRAAPTTTATGATAAR